jgi:hypothetical protein
VFSAAKGVTQFLIMCRFAELHVLDTCVVTFPLYLLAVVDCGVLLSLCGLCVSRTCRERDNMHV